MALLDWAADHADATRNAQKNNTLTQSVAPTGDPPLSSFAHVVFKWDDPMPNMGDADDGRDDNDDDDDDDDDDADDDE